MKNKLTYIFYLLLDLGFLAIAFLFFIWIKPATLTVYLPNYIKPFLGFAVLWLITSMLTGKYRLHNKVRLFHLVENVVRTNIFALAVALVLIFIFKRFSYSRSIVFGTILLATILEFFFCLLLTLQRKYRRNFESSENLSIKPVIVSPKFDDTEVELPELPELDDLQKSIYFNLKNRYLLDQPKLLSFLKNRIPLDKIAKNVSLILNTHTFFNVENIEPESQQFFMNLHVVNDYRRLNRYFIQINKNLKQGGFFIGTGETIADRYIRYFEKYPTFLAVPIYAIDFIFKRVIPKLPVLKVLYFAITKGENRSISYTEIMGRLYYCGFKVLTTTKIKGKIFYIAVKVKNPAEIINPTYGPYIKLRRIGKDGEIIHIYKLRTMHPYSEFLQKFVYENSDLEGGGKFKDDFRITGWGKVFRKLWIDELPQFVNFFRGEVGLVGVRALSDHYFSLYPEDMQELRCKFKPGLVPPFYADMPTTFEEIVESERKYLMRRSKKPFSTQVIYFCKAWWNILVKKARSQ